MKILHILSQRPDSTGSGIYLKEILRNADNAGYSNYLICGLPFGETSVPPPINKKQCQFIHFETDDLPFPIVGMSDIMPYPSTRFCDLTSEQLEQYINKFKKIIQQAIVKFKPDIIHSHHLWLASSLVNDVAAGIPVVTNCHGSDIRQFKNLPSLRDRVQKGCVQINHVFALSNTQQDEIASLYKIPKDKISIVGGGFNNELFNTHNRSKNSDCIRLLYAGKLSFAKGVPYLLSALSEIKHTNYHLTLVGAGNGQEGEECLSLAAQQHKQVTILPPVNQHELSMLFQDTDLFILPSLFEGMPLVVLEALACGCEVLASHLSGVKEIIDRTKTNKIKLITLPKGHSSNRLTREHQSVFIKNIYKQLDTLLQTFPSHSTNGSCAIEYFNWNNVFQRIQSVYRALI